MVRLYLLLALAAPVWATPITGTFDVSAGSNFADITGSGFAWQFHQGNGGSVYTVCPGALCLLDGSAAPATMALLNSNNWFRAINGSAEAVGNLKPGQVQGSIGGSFSWHVSRTDWSDVPAGTPTAVSVPMDIHGVLTANDAQGNAVMNKTVSGTGNFETTVIRSDSGLTFFGAAGRFNGNVVDPNDGAGDPVSNSVAGAAGNSGESGTSGESANAGDNGNSGSAPTGAAVAPGSAPGGSAAEAAGAASGNTATPESATYLLLGLGLAALALRRRWA